LNVLSRFILVPGVISSDCFCGGAANPLQQQETMTSAYLDFLQPLYVESLRDAAHTLAEPRLCFGIPCVYFLLTVIGYGVMRNVDFYVIGGKVSARKGKQFIPGTIVKVLHGGKSFEVDFGTKESEVLTKDKITAVGYAPPDWFKLSYNLAQVFEYDRYYHQSSTNLTPPLTLLSRFHCRFTALCLELQSLASLHLTRSVSTSR
jgi:hypothetical protein